MTDMPQRRMDDRRVSLLVTDVAELKRQMNLNTDITRQVHDILTSFRVIAKAAKWFTAIAGGIAAGLAVVKGWRP